MKLGCHLFLNKQQGRNRVPGSTAVPHHSCVPGCSGGSDRTNEIRSQWSCPLSVSHLEEERWCEWPTSEMLSCIWTVEEAGTKTASRGHMLLYIPIRITLLWNVRKCVVSASASSLAPQSHPEVLPSSSSGLCASRGLPQWWRESLRILAGLLSHRPFFFLWVRRVQGVIPASQTSCPLGREAMSSKDFSQNQPWPSKSLPPVILLLKWDVSANQTEL